MLFVLRPRENTKTFCVGIM